jgi:hypothetical protein
MPWKSDSAEEYVTTCLPNEMAVKMNREAPLSKGFER